MSSSKADPRREESIVPFHLPKKGEEEDDYNHLISTFVAMGSIMTRNRFKMLPWVAAYFGFVATLNTRKTLKSKDSMGGSGAFLAMIALFTYYLNLYLVHKKSLDAIAAGDSSYIPDAVFN